MIKHDNISTINQIVGTSKNEKIDNANPFAAKVMKTSKRNDRIIKNRYVF